MHKGRLLCPSAKPMEVCIQWSLSTLSLFSLSPGLSRSQGPSPWRRREHILGLPPVCLCDCHQGKGSSLPLPVGAFHDISPPASEVLTCSSAERRCAEEGALCAGHAGHETLSAIRTKGAGLGCWPSEQPATELLLLWRSWGVSDEGCELGAGVVVVVERAG